MAVEDAVVTACQADVGFVGMITLGVASIKIMMTSVGARLLPPAEAAAVEEQAVVEERGRTS